MLMLFSSSKGIFLNFQGRGTSAKTLGSSYSFKMPSRYVLKAYKIIGVLTKYGFPQFFFYKFLKLYLLLPEKKNPESMNMQKVFPSQVYLLNTKCLLH